MELESVRKKLLVIGDGTVGKTCLLVVYTQNTFPEKYIPTVFENHIKELTLLSNDNSTHKVELVLWDTAGQEEVGRYRLRSLYYPNSDVVLICFAIDNPDSLENVAENWIQEVRHFCPKIPVLLVGTKTDLRNDPATLETLAKSNQKPVTEEEGKAMAHKINALGYFETSAKENKGVQEVFERAARASIGLGLGLGSGGPTSGNWQGGGRSRSGSSLGRRRGGKCVLL